MHPCVRLSRYERDRVMSFVPPDGKFKLASYSVNTSGQVPGPPSQAARQVPPGWPDGQSPCNNPHIRGLLHVRAVPVQQSSNVRSVVELG